MGQTEKLRTDILTLSSSGERFATSELLEVDGKSALRQQQARWLHNGTATKALRHAYRWLLGRIIWRQVEFTLTDHLTNPWQVSLTYLCCESVIGMSSTMCHQQNHSPRDEIIQHTLLISVLICQIGPFVHWLPPQRHQLQPGYVLQIYAEAACFVEVKEMKTLFVQTFAG